MKLLAAFALVAFAAASEEPADWVKIAHCNGDGSPGNRKDRSYAQINLMATYATAVRICTKGSRKDCVTANAGSYPMEELKLIDNDDDGVSHYSDANVHQKWETIENTWTGPENRVKQLFSPANNERMFFHASHNSAGLHFDLRENGHCEWDWEGSDKLVMELLIPKSANLGDAHSDRWTTIAHCDGDKSNGERKDVSYSQMNAMAKTAEKVRICTKGSSSDCVTASAGSYPMRELQQIDNDDEGVSHVSDSNTAQSRETIENTWTGPSQRISQLYSPKNNERMFFHASHNSAGLHFDLRNRGHCEWDWGTSDNLVMQLLMPAKSNEGSLRKDAADGCCQGEWKGSPSEPYCTGNSCSALPVCVRTGSKILEVRHMNDYDSQTLPNRRCYQNEAATNGCTCELIAGYDAKCKNDVTVAEYDDNNEIRRIKGSRFVCKKDNNNVMKLDSRRGTHTCKWESDLLEIQHDDDIGEQGHGYDALRVQFDYAEKGDLESSGRWQDYAKVELRVCDRRISDTKGSGCTSWKNLKKVSGDLSGSNRRFTWHTFESAFRNINKGHKFVQVQMALRSTSGSEDLKMKNIKVTSECHATPAPTPAPTRSQWQDTGCVSDKSTPNEGHWNQKYYHKTPLAPHDGVKFSVKARNDGHFGFLAPHGEYYEIVVGGWGNRHSKIRKGNFNTDTNKATRKWDKVGHNEKNILNGNEFYDFWASAENGLVQIGKGTTFGKDIFLQWQDPNPLNPTDFAVMTGWGATGEWKVCNTKTMPVPKKGCIGPAYTPDKAQHYYHRTPLRKHDSVTFTIKARNDAHFGFMAEHGEYYEVVVGGWGNTQSRIRKGRYSPKGTHDQAGSKSDKASDTTRYLLNGNEDREFWASAKDGLVQVGKGHRHGKDIIMSWQDPSPLDVKDFAIMTGWGASGNWDVCNLKSQ